MNGLTLAYENMNAKELLAADAEYFRTVVEPLTVFAAQHFGLTLKRVEHKKFGRQNKNGSLTVGLCSTDKVIRVLIRPYIKGGFCSRLEDKEIIRTIAHELAHLKHFNHSKAHTDFEEEIFQYIYFRKER